MLPRAWVTFGEGLERGQLSSADARSKAGRVCAARRGRAEVEALVELGGGGAAAALEALVLQVLQRPLLGLRWRRAVRRAVRRAMRRAVRRAVRWVVRWVVQEVQEVQEAGC